LIALSLYTLITQNIKLNVSYEVNSFLCHRITARQVGRIYVNGRKEQKEKAKPKAEANAKPEVEHTSPEAHQMILKYTIMV
jgi:hypothetical protein